MYWPFTPVPEIADLPPAEQKRVWAEAVRDRSSRKDLFVVAFTVFVVGLVFVVPLIAGELLLPTWLRWPLRGVIFILGGVAFQAVMVRHYRRVLRRRRGGG